jgi:hypothetical protein
MKLGLPWLLAVGVVVAVPRANAQMDQGPAQAPQAAAQNDVELRGGRHCTQVRPGDMVHFTLTVDGVANAKAVLADLQLTTGHATYRETDLPMPGSGVLGGGGAGARRQHEQAVPLHVPGSGGSDGGGVSVVGDCGDGGLWHE